MKLFLNLIIFMFFIFNVVGCVDVLNNDLKTSIISSNVNSVNDWEWLKENCSRIKLEYNKDGDGNVSYAIMAYFYTPTHPIGARGIYVDDSSFEGVLKKAIKEIKNKM